MFWNRRERSKPVHVASITYAWHHEDSNYTQQCTLRLYLDQYKNRSYTVEGDTESRLRNHTFANEMLEKWRVGDLYVLPRGHFYDAQRAQILKEDKTSYMRWDIYEKNDTPREWAFDLMIANRHVVDIPEDPKLAKHYQTDGNEIRADAENIMKDSQQDTIVL